MRSSAVEGKDIIDIVKIVIAGAVAFWHGLPELTRVLVILMAFDVAFHVAVGIKNRELSPTALFIVVTQKVGALVLISIAALFAPYVRILDVNLSQAAVAFYIVPQLLSITKKAAEFGIPVYGQLDMILQYFRSASGQGGTSAPSNPEKPRPDPDRT